MAKSIIKDLETGDMNKRLLEISTTKIDTLIRINSIQRDIITNADKQITYQHKIIENKDKVNDRLLTLLEKNQKNTNNTNKILAGAAIAFAIFFAVRK